MSRANPKKNNLKVGKRQSNEINSAPLSCNENVVLQKRIWL
jgi:hypothetical protein